MSVTTLADCLPAIPDAKTFWFKAPDAQGDPNDPQDLDNWPKAARRLWKILMGLVRKQATTTITLPVWKLAELSGRGLRWVWKALKQLLGLGRIRRFWFNGRVAVENRKGHQGDVGRATEVLIADLASPEPKAKAKPAVKTRATAKSAATQVSLTPEQLAANQANLARVQSAEEPSATAAEVSQCVKQAIAKVKADCDRQAVAKGIWSDEDRRKQEEALAEMEEHKRRQRATPAGPGVPAPEPGS